ncbi:MAG: response regulator transcription factor [Acidimicrobiia bacterium]|nr:response regulator transcription factor [Acidimicrobiia bacterium]
MQIALYPAEPSDELDMALALAAIDPLRVTDVDLEKEGGAAEWSLLIVELADEPLRRLRTTRRLHEDTGIPTFLVVTADQTAFLDEDEAVADFIVLPIDPGELKTRVRRLHLSTVSDELLRYQELELNTATYQATLSNDPVDLTYMEYELLRFFVENQGRVWSREQLLSKVWGYDYFGGARTVDVHVRRLRSKLGEERSPWITTVRSVGYRFG